MLDFKSIELCLMAHLSEDPVLIETLHSQGDIFSQLASEWYIYTINLNSYSGDYYKGGGGGVALKLAITFMF